MKTKKNNRVESKKENLERRERESIKTDQMLDKWIPKTAIGKKVKVGEIKDIEDVFKSDSKILEAEIVDALIPEMEYDLLRVGQSKGKFGGGKRSIWKTTQKKTKEGNKPKFLTIMVVGNKDGYVGISEGKSKETVIARDKATRKAKLNLTKIRRGCGHWECGCKEPHSVPLKVSGKCGSVEIQLIPAPKGTGLVAQNELRKILGLAGIKDVYTSKKGKTKTGMNLVKACFNAMKNLNKMKINEEEYQKLGVIDGRK